MLKKAVIIILFIALAFTRDGQSQIAQASDISVHKEYMLSFKESEYKQNKYLNKYSDAVVPNSERGYTVYVDPNAGLDAATNKALNMWHKKTKIEFKFTNNINAAQIRVYHAYLGKKVLGVTHFYSERFNKQGMWQVAYAKIEINKETIAENRDSTVKIIAHEVGHAMGLDHNKKKESIMYYSDLNNSWSRIIKSDIKIAKRINQEFCKIATSSQPLSTDTQH